MKKFLVLNTIIGVFTILLASSTWTCYRYIDGKVVGEFIKVSADIKEEAEQKAYDKYKELGYDLDYVVCE